MSDWPQLRRIGPLSAMTVLLAAIACLGAGGCILPRRQPPQDVPPGADIWQEAADRLGMTIMAPHCVPQGFSLPATLFDTRARTEVRNPHIAPGDQLTVFYVAEDGRRIEVHVGVRGDLGETPVQVVTVRGHRARLFTTEIAQAPPHVLYVLLVWNEPSSTGEAIPYFIEATGVPAEEVIRMAESMRPLAPREP